MENLIFTLQLYQVKKFENASEQSQKKNTEPGNEYADLIPFLKGINKIGYLTDKEIATQSVQAKKLQYAQYMLAPVSLDVGSIDHQLILIDYDNLENTMDVIETLGARLVYHNPHNKLLVERLP